MTFPDLRTALITSFGPGCLAGISLFDWITLLAQNRFRVHPKYFPRAASLTVSSAITSVVGLCESLITAIPARQTAVKEPVFILGCWRSGTTHLHNLMCADDRYAYPNLYQTMYPHTWVLSEPVLRPLMGMFLPKKRFMDNVVMGLQEPAEDEMALGIVSLRSNMFSWVFPANASRYDPQLSFESCTPRDRRLWQDALEGFLKKLAWKTGKPLILKSPNHTARINLILERFPDAKFLHIHRNPYDVFRSMCHMANKVIPVWGLQKYDMSRIPQMVIEAYAHLYDAYFSQVKSIPQGQFFEIGYDELSADPMGRMEAAYSALGLPDFSLARPKMQRYVDSVSDYQRNQHASIDPAIREQILARWPRSFDTWGYER
ncbi:MAG: sulfotransferase [Planctomycetaceae bacterium]